MTENKKEEWQRNLDALKNKIAGDEIIKYEDIKRESHGETLYDLGWLDKNKGTSLQKIDDDSLDIVVRKQTFLDSLEKQIVPGRNINEYRELKTFLVEHVSHIDSRIGLSERDLKEYLDKLDDLIFETNVERYTDAVERLSDDVGFVELNKMHEEYHKTVETLAIQTTMQEHKKLSSSTINLLDILRGDKNND